jgi:hypothetical protein
MTTAPTTFRRSLTPGRVVPIARGLDLYLCVQAGSGEHLADCFLAALERIPRPASNRILEYWAGGDLPARPTLELLPQLRPGKELRPCAPAQVYAVTDELGHRQRYCAAITDRMPAHVLAVLIVHELTHSWQWLSQPPEIVRQMDLEAHAREITSEWGFDPDLLDHWRPSTSLAPRRRRNYVSYER